MGVLMREGIIRLVVMGVWVSPEFVPVLQLHC